MLRAMRVVGIGFRIAGIAALLFLLVILTPIAWLIAGPLQIPSNARHSDVIALFSSSQIDDTWLSPDAAQRTLGALLLFREGFAPVIVTSGSQHAAGLDQAELHAAWLVRAGVPASDIVIENHSTRTYASVVALKGLMRAHGWRSVVIVTSAFDILRIRLVCERLDVDATFLGVPDQEPPYFPLYLSGYGVLYHAMYEYAGLALYRFKGWL